ncbi:11941_t:CDS:2, partial [Diversispora eburnea]
MLDFPDFPDNNRNKQPPNKRMKVENADNVEDLNVMYWTLWDSYVRMDLSIMWTPATNAWKEGLARLLGLTLISNGLASYFRATNFDKWNHINCLEYLAKVCRNLVSDDRTEIINQYKAQLRSISSYPWTLQKARNKANKMEECAENSFKRKDTLSFFERLDIQACLICIYNLHAADTDATYNLVNGTNELVNAKGNLFESKLKVSTYNKIIESVPDENPMASPTEFANKRKHNEKEDTFKTPPPTSPNKDSLLSTPNKRQMYLNAMENSLKHTKVTVQKPSLWTESLKIYIDNVLKKSGDEFKAEIMRKIEGDEDNRIRLYCEKVLMDLRIGERKYIVQNISSLFKYYESTFGNLCFNWIESHSPASKLTKSHTSSGIVKVDARGVRLFDDKEIFHVE